MTTTSQLIGRLAAANPMPTGTSVHEPAPLNWHPRQAALAVAACAAIAIPAAAFADDIGNLLGFSNQGSPVAADTLPFGHETLSQAMQDLNFPTTMQLLGSRDGITFYAAPRPDGRFCFAVDTPSGQGAGCDLNPLSTQYGIVDFSHFTHGSYVAGFAADGVASVALTDAAGTVVATAPVIDNLYAGADPGDAAVATGIEALDANGQVVSKQSFGQTG